MTRFILRKFFSFVVTIFCVISLTFLLMKVIPGDPFSDEKALPKEIHESLMEHYGLNAPVGEQYVKYLQSVIKWDLGPSFKYKGRTVNQLIKDGFPVSLMLGAEALVIAIGTGVILGALTATYQKGWLKAGTSVFVMVGVSLPSFACATFLQYLLSIKYQIFPVARWGTFYQTILPALSLALLPAAFITRLIKNQMGEIIQKDYVKVCRAKGLSDGNIILRHVLKNTLLPLFAYLGQLSANILVGSFVVEKIFSIPGLGQWFVKSVMNRDYTVIMGLTVFYCIVLVSSIFIFDLLTYWLDPRLRSAEMSDKHILQRT